MGWTRFVTRNALLVIIGSFAVTVLLANYALGNLGISTQTEDMIAEDLDWRQDFIRFRNEFPDLYRMIIVVVTADTEAKAQAAVVHLNGLLENMSDYVTSTYSPTVDEPLAGNELLFLDTDTLEDLAEKLSSAQPFFGRLREHYSLATLLDMIARSADAGRLEDAGSLPKRVATIIDETTSGHDRLLDWSDLTADGERIPRRLIFVQPVLDTSIPRSARYALDAIRKAGVQTTAAFDAHASVQLTGIIALEDEELVNVAENARTVGLLTLVSVMFVLLLTFRNLKLLFISLVTLIVGLIGTAAFAAWSVHSLNIISVAFAVLYIGLGIDFAIHYLLRVREVSAQRIGIDAALETASGEVGGSIFICAITTAAGFYAFIPTSFVGVSQLGLISGTGMFISFATTLTVIPALIRVLFPAGLRVPDSAASWAPGQQVARLLVHRRLVLAVPLILASLTFLNIDRIRFESDPMLLRDPAMDSVKTFRELSQDPDTAPSTISVLLPPGRDVDAASDALENLPTVARAISLRSFELVAQPRKLDIIEDLSLILGPTFDLYPQLAAVDVAETLAKLETLNADLDQEQPALQEALSRLQVRLEPMQAEERQRLLLHLQRNLLGDLPGAMHFLATRLQPDPVPAARFPNSFIARWRAADGTQLMQLTPAEDINDPAFAARFVNEVLEIEPQATGLPIVYAKSGDTVIAAFVQAIISALIIITILLLLLFRSGYYTVLVLAPMAVAAVLLTGAMLLIDMPFNFANIIALPLLLGIGVDTGIHLVHRARESVNSGERLLATSTSRAIFFSSVTTLASFGNLGLSTHRGMASMGILLGAGLVIILVVMISVLPVLLSMGTKGSGSPGIDILPPGTA